MNLLTDRQIAAATREDLLDLVRILNSRLNDLDEEAVLAVTRATLSKLGVTHIKRITVGVHEWDNGYFWSGISKLETARGTEVNLSERTILALEKALDESLTQLAYSQGHVGRHDELVIDLVNHRVDT